MRAALIVLLLTFATQAGAEKITKLIQSEFNRLGCNVGKADGAIGPASKRGLKRFSIANKSFMYDMAVFSDPKFLKLLKSKQSGFCRPAAVQSLKAGNDFFRCDRVFASSANFKPHLRNNIAALNKQYPLELKIVIAENKSWFATYYGIDKDRSKNERKFDNAEFRFFSIKGNNLRSEGIIHVHVHSPGIKSGPPTKYKCDKLKKTKWKPDP